MKYYVVLGESHDGQLLICISKDKDVCIEKRNNLSSGSYITYNVYFVYDGEDISDLSVDEMKNRIIF